MTDATQEKVETSQFWIGDIAAETEKEALEKHLEQYGATLKKWKLKAKQPWAICTVPTAKSDAFSAATHEVNGATLSVDPVWKTINYFLDTRMSKGSLNELSAEKVEEYFTQFGQVAKLNIVEGKGFAFLQMVREEGNEAVDGLAWKDHEIDGHVINVKEQANRKRKRKWNGKKKWGNKKKWKKKKNN